MTAGMLPGVLVSLSRVFAFLRNLSFAPVFSFAAARNVAMAACARCLILVAALFAGAAVAQESADSSGDVFAEWCLDLEAKEIYTLSAAGARQNLVIAEAVVADGGEVIDNSDTERMFDEGLVEAIDGADALDTSFAADAWETVIEMIYGHDAFGQRIEIVGAETTNESGHRCKMLKAPGFSTMFRAFWES